MERSLEEPLFRAEMARAEIAGRKNGIARESRYAAGAGLLILIGLIIVAAVR